jgi:excisionase family DNA binding protein
VDDGSTVPGLLSIPDSAAYLGVSVATLYREIAAGALPTVQIRDRRRMVRLSALEAYINAREAYRGGRRLRRRVVA